MFTKRYNFMTVGGINIGIDLSWFFIAILLSWTLAAGHFPFVYPGYTTGLYWLMGIIGMLGLFVCIVLHELGHAFVAKYYKLPITQITLFLFGGVAEIKKDPESPKVEFLVAIAGPLVTLVLVGILLFITSFGVQAKWPFMITGITSYLTIINLLILIFNLVPAFPLDGGRILRAILWKCKGNLGWATKVTTRIGSGFGIFLLFLGVFSFITGNILGGLWLVILGLFLQRAASSSQTQFYVSQELRDEAVDKFMTKNIESVSPDITISKLLGEHMYVSHHHLYPVTENDELLGYISLQEIRELPQQHWDTSEVRSILVPVSRCKTVTSNTNALEALSMMQESASPTLLVVEGSKLVGLLTSQDLFKIISLKINLEDERKSKH
jgi:Zn-dependent protease/predicted transcriptional regulator